MTPTLIAIAAFVGVVALIGGLAVVLHDYSAGKLEDRLDTMTGRAVPAQKRGLVRDEAFAEAIRLTPGLIESFTSRLVRLPKLFEQADTGLGPNRFLALSLTLAAAGAVAVGWLRAPVALLPVAAGIPATMPLFWLLMRRRRRLKTFGAQLPDALDLVARALRAGHSLAAGMHVVSEEMPSPIATEFGRVYEEQNLGIPLEDALRNMTGRVPNLDLKFFVTAVQLQRQTGGDLAEILDKISYVIRERFKIYGQVQALTAEGRLSGVVLMLLPPALFLAVYYLNPKYVSLLFSESTGRQMLVAAIVMQVLGALVIKKIVTIKV